GYQPSTVIDFEVPKRYGLRQTIADTLGIGGIMRALRTIPVLLDMARDMEELCPDVLFLNYTNPMAMLVWALARATRVRTVALCHSVQDTAAHLARLLDIPEEELNFVCAGINHLAFYLRLEHRGRDLYPALRRLIEEGRVPAYNRVRFEMLRRLGYFVTESSEHFAEYVPWFIKRDRPDLIERFAVQPTRVGALPPHLAALMQTNVNVQALTVEAALAGKREHIYHAAMLDPHTAAELDLDQVHALVDELIAAHGEWLPAYH